MLIRRARLRASGELRGLHGLIELDGNTVSGATARLNAATIDWSWRPRSIPATEPALVTITAGLFKIPFGADVPTADRDRIFLEPGWAARALFPGNYDGGAMLAGGWRFARWQVAITNGAPVGDAQWTGRDPTSAPDLVGRAGIDLELGGVTARGGLSGLVGTGLHAGTPATKDQLTWVDANEDGMVQTTELGVIPGRPATPSETFARSALGADLAITWCAHPLGHGQAFGEVAIATDLDRAVVVADPVAADRSLRELGWQVGAWQELGRWARIGVRYDAYRPDRDAREVQGANVVGVDPRFTTLAALASLRWREHRATLEYDHERNPLGRGLDGQPTTRGADRLTARLQVTW
ncbi:MAG: hypothetical protein K8W52_06545 [Deltaproteobacteria bacterium]|nr:hypothetical protein [Deltaproteobacteria bacterium]